MTGCAWRSVCVACIGNLSVPLLYSKRSSVSETWSISSASCVCGEWTSKWDVGKVHLVQGIWSQQKLIMLIETLFVWWHTNDTLLVRLGWCSLWCNFWVSVKWVQFGQEATGLGNCVFSKPCCSGAVQVSCWSRSAYSFLAINLMITKWLTKP